MYITPWRAVSGHCSYLITPVASNTLCTRTRKRLACDRERTDRRPCARGVWPLVSRRRAPPQSRAKRGARVGSCATGNRRPRLLSGFPGFELSIGSDLGMRSPCGRVHLRAELRVVVDVVATVGCWESRRGGVARGSRSEHVDACRGCRVQVEESAVVRTNEREEMCEEM